MGFPNEKKIAEDLFAAFNNYTQQLGLISAPAGNQGSSSGRTWDWMQNIPNLSVQNCMSQPSSGTSSRCLPSLVSFTLPAKLSKPLEKADDIQWPQNMAISTAMQQLLLFLACSNEGDHLLKTTQLDTRTFQALELSDQNIITLQYHLRAVVEKLRNPKESEPLQAEDLTDLERLIDLFVLSPPTNGEDLYVILCANFIEESSSNDDSSSTAESNTLFSLPKPMVNKALNMLSMPQSLAEARRIEDSDIPRINSWDFQKQEKLNYFLKLLAFSSIGDAWLGFPQKGILTNPDHLELQGHLAAIVNQLRSPNPLESLRTEHLEKLLELFKKCRIDSDVFPPRWLKSLCLMFNGTVEEFRLLYTSLLLDIYPDEHSLRGVMTKPQHLARVTPIDELELPNLENDTMVNLTAVLFSIGGSSGWDQLLERELPVETIQQGAQESNADYLLRCIEGARLSVFNEFLQQHLCGIIHAMRSGANQEPGTARLGVEDIKKLNFLLNASECPKEPPSEILLHIGRMLQADSSFLEITRAELVLVELDNSILEVQGTLRPCSDHGVSGRLPNLGATCYINSVLQMVAHMDYFDEMLLQELVFYPPQKYNEEGDESYQIRCQQARENFESKLPARTALQKHLKALIHRMRESNSEIIDKAHLTTLFTLLQINGWNQSKTSQHDPHEFLNFLCEVLNFSNPSINLVEKYTYEKEGNPHHFQVSSVHSELALPLPIDERHCLKPGLMMEDLIENYRHDNMTLTPPEEKTTFSAQKTSYIVGPAPKTLLIQQKRFGFNGAPFRIMGALPYSRTITVPVYKDDDLSAEPEQCRYRLHIAICHESLGGFSNSANSGHYTTYVLQQESQEAARKWVHYDDSHPIRQFSPSPSSEGVQAIREQGYYFVYVLSTEMEHSEGDQEEINAVQSEGIRSAVSAFTAYEGYDEDMRMALELSMEGQSEIIERPQRSIGEQSELTERLQRSLSDSKPGRRLPLRRVLFPEFSNTESMPAAPRPFDARAYSRPIEGPTPAQTMWQEDETSQVAQNTTDVEPMPFAVPAFDAGAYLSPQEEITLAQALALQQAIQTPMVIQDRTNSPALSYVPEPLNDTLLSHMPEPLKDKSEIKWPDGLIISDNYRLFLEYLTCNPLSAFFETSSSTQQMVLAAIRNLIAKMRRPNDEPVMKEEILALRLFLSSKQVDVDALQKNEIYSRVYMLING